MLALSMADKDTFKQILTRAKNGNSESEFIKFRKINFVITSSKFAKDVLDEIVKFNND